MMPNHEKLTADLVEIRPKKLNLYTLVSMHYQAIETSIERGASYEDIISALGENGIEISHATFTKYLYRMRIDAGRTPREISKKPLFEPNPWIDQEMPDGASSIEGAFEIKMPEKYKDWFFRLDSDNCFFTYKIPKGTYLNKQLVWLLESCKKHNEVQERFENEAQDYWNLLQYQNPTDGRKVAG